MLEAEGYYALRHAAKNKHFNTVKGILNFNVLEYYPDLIAEISKFILQDLENYPLDKQIKEFLSIKIEESLVSKFCSNIKNGNLNEIKLIPENKIFKYLQDNYFISFGDAAGNGHTEVIKFLLEMFIDKKQLLIESQEYYPFRNAALEGQVEMCRLFIQRCNPEKKAEMLASVNFYAFNVPIKINNTGILKLLLANCSLSLKEQVLPMILKELMGNNSFQIKLVEESPNQPVIYEITHPSCKYDSMVNLLRYLYLYDNYQLSNNPTTIAEYYNYFQQKFKNDTIYPSQLYLLETAYKCILPMLQVSKSPVFNWDGLKHALPNEITATILYYIFPEHCNNDPRIATVAYKAIYSMYYNNIGKVKLDANLVNTQSGFYEQLKQIYEPTAQQRH